MQIYDRLKKMKAKDLKQFQNIIRDNDYGEYEEVVSYIEKMPILSWEGKGILNLEAEVRCDDRFIVICEGRHVLLLKTEALACTFFIPYEGNYSYDNILLLFKSGWQKKVFINKKHSWDLFQKLSSYGSAYENIQCKYTPFEMKYLGTTISVNKDTVTITKEVSKFFKKEKEEKVYRTQDIIWYEEYFSCSSEEDYFEIRLYMLDGTIIPETVERAMMYDCRVAARFRHNIPHLLYGSNPEYKRIFERDPKELMKLAEEKMRARNS